jgi:hypothetical protein
VSRARTRWVAWSLWAFTLGCGLVTIAFAVVLRRDGIEAPTANLASLASAFVPFQTLATVGALVAARRPGNAVGWLFCTAAALCQWANLVQTYSVFADNRGLPGVVWLNVVFAPAWGTGLALVATLGFLLFPDGRPPSPRWRWLIWLSVATISIQAIASVLAPGDVEGTPGHHANPIGVQGLSVVGGIAWVLELCLLLGAVGSLVVRFRRSSGIERQQLKVFAGAVGLVVCAVVALVLASQLTGVLDSVGAFVDVIWLLVFALVPVAVGLAIMRYRLYEFDRIVSRTLVYGASTALLAGTYVGLVIAGQSLFSSVAGGSSLAVALSTLVAAALFMPVRARVQRVVDRRFYRRRYDAEQTLDGFAARVRNHVELDALASDMLAVVDATVQPAGASIWLVEAQP